MTARDILANYAIGAITSLEPITTGLINTTYRVNADQGHFILQRMSAIFNEDTVRDTQKVTAHLAQKNIPTPTLITAMDGAAFMTDTEGRVWRLMTEIDGQTFDKIPEPSYAFEAGRVLAAFHRGMTDFDASQLKSPLKLHDTKKIYAEYASVYDILMCDETDSEQRRVYTDIFETLPKTFLPDDLPTTVVHGDPKINNIIFKDGHGVCLIDLDTCMRHTALVDIGDALRSWCNEKSEDAGTVTFSLPIFEQAMRGYAAAGTPVSHFKEYIAQATRMITMELAARFAKDVVDDRYFGWDKKRFSSRKEHNRVRTLSMVLLAEDIVHKERAMLDILRALEFTISQYKIDKSRT